MNLGVGVPVEDLNYIQQLANYKSWRLTRGIPHARVYMGNLMVHTLFLT